MSPSSDRPFSSQRIHSLKNNCLVQHSFILDLYCRRLDNTRRTGKGKPPLFSEDALADWTSSCMVRIIRPCEVVCLHCVAFRCLKQWLWIRPSVWSSAGRARVKSCNPTLGIGRFCLLVSSQSTTDGSVVNIQVLSDLLHRAAMLTIRFRNRRVALCVAEDLSQAWTTHEAL